MADFEAIFPTFIARCAELRLMLQPVAFLFFVVGLILVGKERWSARKVLHHLGLLLLLTALLVYLPAWGNGIQELLQSSILDGLGLDPQAVHDQYNAMVVAKRDFDTGRSWWDLLARLTGFSVESFITGSLWLLGHVASLLLYWAYVVQKVLLFIAYALSPLMLGFMAIPYLRGTGIRFLLNLSGVLLWPLGWAVAALVTQGILDFMTDPAIKFIDPTATGYRLQTTVGLAVVAFWILFSTVAAPVFLQRLLSSGSLVAGELLSHATGGFLQTAATTAGAAAVGSTLGLPAVTAASAAMAATLSTLSTAAGHGSAGAIIIAGSGLPARSTRGRTGDDLTGDRAVRDLLARQSRPPF